MASCYALLNCYYPLHVCKIKIFYNNHYEYEIHYGLKKYIGNLPALAHKPRFASPCPRVSGINRGPSSEPFLDL